MLCDWESEAETFHEALTSTWEVPYLGSLTKTSDSICH